MKPSSPHPKSGMKSGARSKGEQIYSSPPAVMSAFCHGKKPTEHCFKRAETGLAMTRLRVWCESTVHNGAVHYTDSFR